MTDVSYNHEQISKSRRNATLLSIAIVVPLMLLIGGVIFAVFWSNPNVRLGMKSGLRELGFNVNLDDELRGGPATAQTPSSSPTIEYSKIRWDRVSDSYMTLNTEVKNTSGQPLEFIKMEASFYDKNDVFVKSESPYIERWQRLAPGDRSPAVIHTTHDPRIKSVRLRFSCKGSRPFETTDIAATEVAKIK